MINLFTGLPGNGKTLYTLWFVKQWVERENAERLKEGKEPREVFYHGINNLMLPWTKIDPQKWMECPPGAVIVIDEAQFVFDRKPNGSKLPKFYEDLAVHRHHGFDLVLITQNPSLVDNFVRKLVGRHLHIVRTFGMERAVVHEWASVREGPEQPAKRRDSIQHKWGYPKEVYTYYKSAEQHTVKRNIPMKVYGLAIALFCVFGLGYYIYKSIEKKVHPEVQQSVSGAPLPVGAVSGGGQSGSMRVSYKNAMDDARQYVFDRTPRVQGLPQTAPRYDELTKPTTVAVPAACISNEKKCSCYTQQATPLNVPDFLCRDIVARGYFVDFDDNAGHSRKDVPSGVIRSDAVVLASNDIKERSVQSKNSSGANVTVLGDENGYGVLGRRGGSLPKSTIGR